jgi:hypothetical protein
VDPRAGLDLVWKRKFLTLPGLELRPFGHPVRKYSLHRLCYPGTHGSVIVDNKLRVTGVKRSSLI